MTAGWAFSAAALSAASGAAATQAEPAAKHKAVSQRADWVKRIGMGNLLSEAEEFKKVDQQKKPGGHMGLGAPHATGFKRLETHAFQHSCKLLSPCATR
jgi:hypothetical protein